MLVCILALGCTERPPSIRFKRKAKGLMMHGVNCVKYVFFASSSSQHFAAITANCYRGVNLFSIIGDLLGHEIFC